MRRTLLKLLVLVVSSAASLAALELGFRAYEARFLVHELSADAPFYDLTSYRYNDHEGFLGRDEAADEYRILSFGDSFAESATLAEHSYASVLQRALSDAASPRRVRVVNLGKSGTSFPDYAARPAELYDWVADPGETRDLVHERPDVARALAAELDRRLAAFAARARDLRPGELKDLSPASMQETLRQLESLGYGGDD